LNNKTKTFCDFTEFYGKSFRENSLFNFNQKFVGRAKELRQLNDFLNDPKQQIIVVSAAGGIGKSKLIYEFTKNSLSSSGWTSICTTPSEIR
jgi:hypothetical protein